MLEMIVAILLALGCPVPPNLPHGPGTVIIMGDDDPSGGVGGDDGHLPPPPPPKP